MLESDRISILCTLCGRDSAWQIGWLRQQPMLACPLCGNEVTGEMEQVLMAHAGKVAER